MITTPLDVLKKILENIKCLCSKTQELIDQGNNGGGGLPPTTPTIDEIDTTFNRASGTNTYPMSGTRGFSITAYSNDVTINGEAINMGQSISLEPFTNSFYVTEIIVTGSDYFVTHHTS